MKKVIFACVLIISVASSCKSVYSTTTIEPKTTFVIGDNEHQTFEVTINNISNEVVEISQKPNDGIIQLLQNLKSKKTVLIIIPKNTALYISNKSENKVAVELNLKSTSHLSMGYKN